MAEHLIKLCQLFNDYKSLPTDLSQKLCSGDALFNHGFQQFYLILKTGLQLIGDDNLGFQSWTDSQIDAVVSLGTAIASVSRSLSVEQVDPIISAVVHQLLEFAVCYLEKSKLTSDDLIIQNNVAHLLEILLVEGLDKTFEPLSHSSINLLSNLLPMLYSDHDGLGLDNHIKCNFQEVCCSSKDKHVDGLLMTLTTECMQSDCQASGFSGIAFRKDLLFTSQHWAVVNVGCIKRLIMCCQKLFELFDMLDEKMAPKNIHKILSFVIRILKLLGSVTKDVQYIGYDMSLLQAFASLTDKFPTLFRLQFDFLNNVLAAEGSVDTLALLLLEEFFHLVRVIFGNSTIFQNIQVCMVASMLASLQTSTRKNSKSAATINQPLAYFPRIVIYVFKAIQDLKRQTYITLDWQKFDSELDGSHADLLENSPSSMTHFSEVSLLKKFDTEELSKVLFPSSSPWMDDLMHLLVFLLSEAIKSGFKVEKYSSTSKANCILESENSAFHEDEALFGNLFSEGGRSVGSTDGYEQSVASSSSGNYNQSIQAVTELLNFLKACIFSNEWLPSVYKNGCKSLSTDHIDILLSILSCRGYGSEYKSSDNCATLPWGVQELSFELLHNLITSHGLSELLEEYLVDRILDVEKGIFICNDLTLTLLAHTLFCRTGLDGCKLRTKVYQVFVTFVMEKATSVCAGCLSIKELIGTLPSVFHIEILLMVFHLSNEEEKLSLARLICSSLHKIDTPTLDCCSGQLSCWALLISRLILLARHMLFFPDACPSWLLLDLQSKLRGAPLSASVTPNALNYHFISWVSVALKSIMGLRVEEEAGMNSLINQLIDVVALVPPIIGDGGIKSLSSIWNDMISTFSRMLGFWNRKKAAEVEDLIIERYIFSLCLDIPSTTLSSNPQVFSRSEFHTCDLSDMANFFDFRNSLLGFSDACDIGINYPDYLVGILQRLCEEHIAVDVEHLGWGFLRNGLWLSMVLSLLRVGIHKYCMRQSIPSIDSLQMGNIPNRCINVAEGLISSILQDGKIAVLLRTLSVLLSRYVKSYQQAFIATLEDEHCNNGDRFSLLLLKHARFDKSLQDELFDKSSDTSWKLASVFDPLTRLDATAEKKASSIFGKVFWESMLHGFPSHTRTPSGILLSSVLSIGGIISVLDGLLRLEDLRSEKYLEGEVLSQTLDSLMTVKFDRIFENLGEKCDAVYRNLNFGLALSDYTNLYLLKQMEELLRGIVAGNVSSKSVVEWVITVFVDIMDNLKKDDPASVTLKFYLGAEDPPEGVKESCSLLYGDLLVLIDAVDGCYSELANVKVLNFFVDLLSREKFSNLKQKMRNKFLNMDVHAMSKWLEKRLLGSVAEVSSGTNCTNGNSLSLRESTMNFVVCLSSSPPEMLSRELQYRLFEALLVSLDIAFSQFDVHIAKSYFYFALQLSKTENSIKLLLKRAVMIMEKMVVEEHLLPSLQFLLGFFGTLLDESRSCKDTSEEASGKSISSNRARMDSMPSAPVEPRKNSETPILSANEGGSISLDCDATSADEDDDYGTSDGEAASLEKEEEDDMDSERALASKVCTFTSSGSNFMEQHWYFCYTCDLTVSKGCCSVCAKVCHRGHRVVYSRLSRFFCDCGAGGVRGSHCQCLKARKFSGNDNAPERGNFQSFLNFSEDAEPESDSDLGEDGNVDAEHSLGPSIPKELQDGIPRLLQDLDLEGQVLELCNSLLHSVTTTRESNITKDKEIILGEDKVVCYGADVLQLKKAYKSGSLDLKIKADYSNTKDLKSHLVSGSLVKSLLSVSIRGRLAVGEGDKVSIFDAGQLIGQATVAPVTADKTNVKPLSRNVVRFEIVHLCFNPVVESYLAVAGYEDCQVLTFNPRGEVTDRIAIELALQGAYIRRINWIPSSQVQLMVVTNKFIKIYDLSQDNISPVHYFTLPDDMIVDATLIAASKGRMFLIVLSEHGNLFRLGMSVEGNVGATPLREVIRIQDREIHAKGASLFFSPTYKLLFLSYHDGTTLMGQLSSDATFLVEISCIYEEQDGKMRAAALHYWSELVAGSGLFACFSGIKSNTAVALSMGAHKFLAQNLKHTVGPASHLVGITAYKPLSKEKVDCLALYDDGSLHIYSYVHPGVESGASATVEKAKKLSPDILNNKAYNGAKPEFPLEFFEKTFGITSDVKLGGDAIRNGDFEAAKQSLASEDGFLESPSASGFKVSVVNSNPDIVMVGFRLHVGSTSANHIPSEISIFQRVIRLDEGMRSWYDVPFTVTESLLADEEFVISIGPTFNRSALPRVDALEVYGRAKDEFGWKEKIDDVLDMEARVLGCNSILSASRKKCRLVQSASIQEQVVAAGFKLLSRFYSMCRLEEEEIKAKMSKLRCKQLLETVFECDSEPLLQAAACHVLQAVFPRKEMYYQVKDTMRLAGVVKSVAVLTSRLGGGGVAGGWIIEEFTAQMRAVSKIAVHRRSNLALFLEMNGSEIVDGLMKVLWGILESELSDTQIMNNIVVSSVELIYSYAECLALNKRDSEGNSVAPAVVLLKKLLFFPNDAVQASSSLAISSRLLQVPFPKQTMLVTDDSIDGTVTASVPAEPTRRNIQVMGEEDSMTSSVQYSCDGCFTVPIIRRRWHCTICPDFDLCEACYQVLDADRLPPPHSRDHSMTAISIEMESLGDSNNVNYPTDDAGNSSLVSVTADVSMKSSAPFIHVLGPNESGDFITPLADPVSISASKRAVNSLLLSELLQQLKGWMRITSGIRSIPVMQLFYRLSSAATGPFTDSSTLGNLDLEKLIKWFLDEFDLNKPFIAGSRSSFGEVAILVFMFFTLMLRNWHQPGNDGVPVKESAHDSNASQISSLVGSHSSMDSQEKKDFASQLLRASNSLRDQVFINYLMDILQQLVQVFKSPMINFETASGLNPGSGCSTLLTVRRDLPAGNFSPFFSDSYGKTHRKDIFRDYYRLLLENAFRLLYTLVRPEKHDKMGEKEKIYKISSSKELKLDGYQDVFCSYINNHHTTFVRRYARRLFLHLCGSKTQYYSVRDSWQLSNEMKKLYKHVRKSGGFQNPVPYERSVKIVKCLSTMAEVAAARPRNWQKYCLKHGDVLPFLMNGVFYFGEESVIQTLKLINLAFYSGKEMGHPSRKADAGESGTGSSKSVSHSAETKKKKGDDGNESGIDKTYLDMEAAADIFTHKNNDILVQFIDCFLLEWNSSSVRTEAKLVLYGVWHHGKYSFKKIVLRTLLQKVKDLPMYGQNITEYTELVTWLLGKNPEINPKQQGTELVESCLTHDVVRCLFETLHSQNELLANHPNSSIYNTLSGMVEFDGYYLESEPCVACSSPEVPYSRMKLESLKSEMKFTDNRIIVKCTGSYTIQTVTMNVHDARKSKSVKVLNLYYNNRPVADLSELKNNWSLWKRAKSCHLASSQTELKVEFSIPITACNFMIELDSFYENLQALSLEPLQCPRCSRPVTDKHGICSNCHENAYQCRQCRNINYENLDSFLCNECGYSKYGRFEFNFTAKPSFTFDDMENDDDMKRGLAAIESESENAHRRYQQLLGFKKPLIKIVSSIGENDIMDSQQKDSVQQMMVSLPGPSCKINRKIALLGVLYGEKCKAAFDSVSKSIQTLQGLRRVLMNYLHQKQSDTTAVTERLVISRSPNNCYGCASTFVTQCLDILHILSRNSNCKKQLVSAGILLELFENNIHQGPKAARVQARLVLCAFSEGDINAVNELNTLIQKKVAYCLEHHRSIDISLASREELLLLSEVCALSDEFWESRLRIVFQLLFSSIKVGVKHPSISEHIILPCLRIIAQACTPPKPETVDKEQVIGKPISATQADEINSNQSGSLTGGANGNKSVTETVERNWDTSHKNQDIQLLTYSEWERGASYLDFVRRQYKVSQAVKSFRQRSRPHKHDYLALKYALRWKHRVGKKPKNDSPAIELGTWVTELVLSSCSQSIRSEMCTLVNLLASQSSSRHFRLLNLLMSLLPATLAAGESASEYFELFFQMIDADDACLFLTARGCLTTICKLITLEVGNIESLEKSLRIDISQGFILHKLIELLGKLLEVANIRSRFMHHNLLSEVLEALIVIRGLIVQKTKLISDCNKLLKDLLDGLLLESSENKRQFIRACISGLHIHGEERKDRNCLFILEQLCNLICPSKPESVYYLVLNKALTQEEFIRGSMTKNPYSSAEMGPLMRDVKNKICHQLDLLGLLEDDFGMELLVAGNIISLDLSIAQVYDQVWTKSNSQSGGISNSSPLPSSGTTSARDYPPMIVTYRLQGLDGEATEPMIKELEEDKEESQDPEVEFAIAGAVREYGGLEILLGMIQHLQDDFKSNQGQLMAVLNLLMHCCKIRENRQALLKLEALALLLETARRAFSVDAMELAEGILLIVESLTLEANESDNIRVTNSLLTFTSQETGTGEEAKKIVLMFLERLCHPSGLKKSNKQQRNTEMVARILPYLTYGEPAAMEALIKHFNPFLQNWSEFDNLQKKHLENPKDDGISQAAAKQRFTVENFVRVSESLKTSSCGEKLKDIILEEGITGVAVKHLKESFPAGFKSSTEWSSGLKLPSIPHILSLLRGLSMGHMATQRCIDEGGILPLLHAMEGVSGENEIGARAENLLDTLSNKEGDGGGFLEEKVRALRHATRDEMRRRALKKRVELLQGLGMRQELDSEGGGRIVVARPLLEGLEDVEEEKNGLACMVCREGYSLRPTDLLGVYSYSKRVNLGIGTSGSARGECVYTTVSYFNIIHFQCHQEAKRADAALKNPKKEWEGATLRNNESLCNSLFPVRGPSVPPAQYVRYVDHYWDNLNALGRAEGSRLRLLTYDIVLMLARFATGASFSAESRGGGRESNSKFLPFMIQMARHLLEQGSPSQIRNMAKSVSTYITSVMDSKSSPTQGPQPSTGTEETVQFMMVNSLLSESYESWLKNRVTFLQRGIYHAYMQHTHGRIESGSDLLSIVHPMLVYTGLIQQLQQFLKTKRVVDVGLVSESESLELWEVVMREKLLNVKEMLRFSKELISWIDDMNSASDLQEALDVIGVLGDVLVEGVTSCEEFVRAAISAGK